MGRVDGSPENEIMMFYLLAGVSACLLSVGIPERTELSTSMVAASAEPFLVDSDIPLFRNNQQCCGVVAAYIALRSIGHQIAVRDVAMSLPVSNSGTSMRELVAFIRGQGFSALPIATTPLGLRHCA